MYSCYWTPLQVFFLSVSKMRLEHKKWWCQRARLSVLAADTKERGSQALLWPVASVWRWGNIQYFEVLRLNFRKRQLRYLNFPVLVWTITCDTVRLRRHLTAGCRWSKWVEWGLQHMGMSQCARGRLWGTICHTLIKTMKLTRTLTLWFEVAVLDLVLCFSHGTSQPKPVSQYNLCSSF